MAPPRTLPRHDGKLVLHDEQTIKKLDIPKGATKEQLKEIKDKLESMLNAYAETFYVQIGVELSIVPDEEMGYYWLIPDTQENSMKHRWRLSWRAIRFGSVVSHITSIGG